MPPRICSSSAAFDCTAWTPTARTTRRCVVRATTASTTTWSAQRTTTPWRPAPVISGVAFMRAFGQWLGSQGLGGSLAATCARHGIPLFVPAAPDGPLAEGYRTARNKGPVVDFFRDYDIALALMNRFMAPGPGTSAIFLGGGVPKDFIQITATSVSTLRGDKTCPHVAAIKITTDN